MRSILIMLILIMSLDTKPQSFYEQMMVLNISLADTSSNWTELERAAGVFNRLSNGSNTDWTACYYMSLCYIRTADLVIKKDTLLARSRISMAKWTLKAADSLAPKEIENKILKLYLEVLKLRMKKNEQNEIKILEDEIMAIKKIIPENPRINLLNAYFYMLFFKNDKNKKIKVKELLNRATASFLKEKTSEYAPHWGRKWCGELLGKLKQ